ncbi:type III secretion system inner rod subunit SctI [Martelella alba]|uniref:Type III secretion system major needle protein (YscF/MxiH/PrgI family) n=1 Tax=Martelella alba TaxID=2590451 RepID=A0ABY2SII2_9HYPH|nr:type III secretion system inner rod subunit SctI [Martelella alba]TKI02799.1 hypothetical protein FCN80_23875 [Martelella alba]
MSIESIAAIGARQTADISPGLGDVASINDIIKESMAQTTADVVDRQQQISRMLNADNLDDPAALGLIQKTMLVYGNTVAFIGTAARKMVGTVETLLRS